MKKNQTNPSQRGGAEADDNVKKVKAVYDHKTKLAVASTATIDRMGEVIDQSGWELANYKQNPVLLFAHNDREIMIGNAKNIKINKAMDNALTFEPDFHEETETARAIKALFEQGRMKTFSVGFMPIEMDGNTYTKQELLEISAVNVPANPDAMMLAYRSMMNSGIKKSVAEDISGVKKAFVTLFKGAIADELANPDEWKIKSNNMDDAFDIFYAFCDVYFDERTKAGDFTTLLKECASLLNKVANGTYAKPNTVQESFTKVLDNSTDPNENELKQAKVPSTAPKRKHHEERLQMAKILAKAADILNKNEKLPDSNRKEVVNVIKRASDKVIEQHKGDLKDNG